MLHAFRPAQIANVHQSVNSLFNFNERAKVSEITHAPFNRGTHRILLDQAVPRIGCKLPHPERNPPLTRIDTQHHAFNLIAYIDQLRRMFGALRPGHFADMDETFDSLLKLDECSVISHADDPPVNMRAYRIAMLGIQPRIRRELLESQRDSLLVAIKLEYLHLNLVADIHQIAGMSEPAPGHVCNVQQTVNAAEVDECSVFGEILDHPGEDRAFLQVLEYLGPLLVLLLLQ